MRYLIGLVILATACGGSDGDPAEAVTCEKTDRSGTYLITLDELSGTCGAVPDQVGRLDDAEALPEGCSFDAPDRWSEGDCKLERAFTCPEPAIGAGVTSEQIAVTEQLDSGGERISGTVTVMLVDADGTGLCKSTYRFEATRQ